MTKPNIKNNDVSVDKFLAGVKDEQKQADCLNLLELVRELTGEPAVMWGQTRIGFDNFHYRGKMSEGNWFHVGFSP